VQIQWHASRKVYRTKWNPSVRHLQMDSAYYSLNCYKYSLAGGPIGDCYFQGMTAQAQQTPLQETQQLRELFRRNATMEIALSQEEQKCCACTITTIVSLQDKHILIFKFPHGENYLHFLNLFLKIRTRFQSFSRRINFNLQIRAVVSENNWIIGVN